MREVTIAFEGGFSGRVVSEDGTIDCAQTCTVEVPAGKILRLRDEVAAGGLEQGFMGGVAFAVRDGERPIENHFLITPLAEGPVQATVRFIPDALGERILLGGFELTASDQDRVLATAITGDRIGAVVSSRDTTFFVNGEAVSASAAASRYVLTRQDATSSWALSPLQLEASWQVEGLTWNEEGSALHVLASSAAPAQFDGMSYGAPGESVIVSFSLSLDGQISRHEVWAASGQVTVLESASSSKGEQVLYLQGQVSDASSGGELGLLRVSAAHAFSVESIPVPTSQSTFPRTLLEVHLQDVMATYGEHLLVWRAGEPMRKIESSAEVLALDPGEAVAVSSLALHRIDLGAGTLSATETFELLDPLFIDLRAPASYALQRERVGMANLRRMIVSPWLLDGTNNDTYNAELAEYGWEGEFELDMVARREEGGAWFLLELTRGRISVDLQGRKASEAPYVLIESLPFATIFEAARR